MTLHKTSGEHYGVIHFIRQYQQAIPYFGWMLLLAAMHVNTSLKTLHCNQMVESYIKFNELLWNYEYIFYEN